MSSNTTAPDEIRLIRDLSDSSGYWGSTYTMTPLQDVHVTTPRDSYYIRRVRQALAASFSKDFKIDVRAQSKHLIEQTDALYQRELASFDLRDARAEMNALVLVVDFRLVIK